MTKKSKQRRRSYWLLEGDVVEKLRGLPDDSFDLIVTSPPYNIGKAYERDSKLDLKGYVNWMDLVIDLLAKKISKTGSICWQVGNYVDEGEVFPLDVPSYKSFKARKLKLRNRIVWRFNFGLHSSKRFSGRYETLLWFTKSDEYKFNLDSIRIPQLYPGKRHKKDGSENEGRLSGNPLGKNPSDYWEFSASECFGRQTVWDIPNVKANHPEKTIHPCQFPIELAERCVLAFTNEGDTVLDPFVGAGTTVLAALKHGRIGVGIDRDSAFLELTRSRINDLRKGALDMRPSGKSIPAPDQRDKVAQLPPEWTVVRSARELGRA